MSMTLNTISNAHLVKKEMNFLKNPRPFPPHQVTPLLIVGTISLLCVSAMSMHYLSTSMSERKVDIIKCDCDQNKLPRIIAGLALTLISLFYIHGVHAQIKYTECYAIEGKKKAREYENNGDYSKALSVLRNCQYLLEEIPFLRLEKIYAEEIDLLENKVLNIGYSHILFNEDFHPRPNLLKLVQLLGMDALNDKDPPILQINQWAQSHLLRNKERWDEQELTFESLKETVLPVLNELGFIDGTNAHFDAYEGAILLGCSLERARKRLDFLIQEWKRGVRFSKVVILTGDRTLESHEKSKLIEDSDSPLNIRKDWTKPKTLPSTEYEMFTFIWEQTNIPKSMLKAVKIEFVRAPMKKGNQGQPIRPTTDDTLMEWNKLSPAQGRYLVISNFPHAVRQDLNHRSFTPAGCSFDTVGAETSDKEKVIIILDEVARAIYECKKAWERTRS